MEKPTRRRLLAAGFSGTALGLLGSRTATASPDTTTPTSDEGSGPGGSAPEATTTTLPPKRPTDEDIPLLQFARQFELAARDLYQHALDAGADPDTITALRDNHDAFATILHGILGTQALDDRDDEVYDQWESEFSTSDMDALAAAAYDLESTAVATHTQLIRELAGTDGARMLASILVVEGRHAVVLADIGGRGDDYDVLFEDDAEPLSPGPTSGG